MQDYGYDTVEANLALGFGDDEREYSVAAHMLMSLKVRSMQLLTNNPRKLESLAALGVRVNGRIPLIMPPNPYNEFYLETKARKSGHLLDPQGKARLPEQGETADRGRDDRAAGGRGGRGAASRRDDRGCRGGVGLHRAAF